MPVGGPKQCAYNNQHHTIACVALICLLLGVCACVPWLAHCRWLLLVTAESSMCELVRLSRMSSRLSAKGQEQWMAKGWERGYAMIATRLCNEQIAPWVGSKGCVLHSG
eukprot:237911-Pelagomonas_calceolata.AAC.4